MTTETITGTGVGGGLDLLLLDGEAAMMVTDIAEDHNLAAQHPPRTLFSYIRISKPQVSAETKHFIGTLVYGITECGLVTRLTAVHSNRRNRQNFLALPRTATHATAAADTSQSRSWEGVKQLQLVALFNEESSC